MELRLQQFIESVETLADIRNLDEFNPIIFQMEHPVTATRYTIAGAKVAPSYLGVPVNTTWIVLDSRSQYYRMALKLVDVNNPDRSTNLPAVNLEADVNQDGNIDSADLLYWNIIRTYDEIFSVPQYYVAGGRGQKGDKGDRGDPGLVDYNLAIARMRELTGTLEIVGADTVQGGTTSQFYVDLTEPEVLPDGTVTAPVTTRVTAPILLTGPVPAGTYMDENNVLNVGALTQTDTYIGMYATYPSWGQSVVKQKTVRLHKQMANITSVVMLGPNSVDSGTTGQFSIQINYQDNTTGVGSGQWQLNNVNFGTISQTGLLNVPSDIAASGSVNVSSTVVIDGVTYTPNKTVSIVKVVAAPTVINAIVVGPDNVDSSTTGQYSLSVSWSDNTTTTPAASWSLSSASYGSINSSGLLTVPGSIAASGVVSVTGTVTIAGTTYTPNKAVNITKIVVVPTVTGVTVSGPNSVNNGSSSQYNISVAWSNGTTTNPAATTWSVDDSQFGTLSASGLYEVPAGLAVGGSVVISASVTVDGTTYNPAKTVTVAVVDNSVLMPRRGTGAANPADFDAFVNGLTAYTPPLTANGKYTMSIDILGTSTYAWFAYPATHGEATFFDTQAGFTGGFGGAGMTGSGASAASIAAYKDMPITRNVTINGQTVAYNLYRSEYPNLGAAAQNQYEVTLTTP